LYEQVSKTDLFLWKKKVPLETSFMLFWHRILNCAILFIQTNVNIIQRYKNTLKFDNEMCKNLFLIPNWNEFQQICQFFTGNIQSIKGKIQGLFKDFSRTF
jgi:hypothetical protein